jgi:hypothetical protein
MTFVCAKVGTAECRPIENWYDYFLPSTSCGKCIERKRLEEELRKKQQGG